MPTGLENIKFFETLDKDPEKIIRPKVNLCEYMFDCLGKNGIFFPILALGIQDLIRNNFLSASSYLQISHYNSIIN